MGSPRAELGPHKGLGGSSQGWGPPGALGRAASLVPLPPPALSSPERLWDTTYITSTFGGNGQSSVFAPIDEES